MRVLVVEDNPKMADAIRKGLTQHNYAVDVHDSGFDAEEAAAAIRYDAIVLDLMLPDRDGVDVCRNLRRRGVTTPILMLTALADTESKIAGLDAGADDYLTKPFEFEELVARIRTLMRRGQPVESTLLKYGDLEFDLNQRRITRAGKPIRLSAKESALLEFFMRNPDRVIARQTLIEKIWDTSYQPASNAIDVHLSSLRKKIDRDFEEAFIHTVLGAGYRFGQPRGDDGTPAPDSASDT
jgi:DNA-binding response OmpR family regulator